MPSRGTCELAAWPAVTNRRREEIAANVERMLEEHRDRFVEALEAFDAAGGEPPAGHDLIPLGRQ